MLATQGSATQGLASRVTPGKRLDWTSARALFLPAIYVPNTDVQNCSAQNADLPFHV
jgi:hypothetical protein